MLVLHLVVKQLYFLLARIRDFALPPVCTLCGELLTVSSIVCTGCSEQIQPIVSHELSITPSISMSVIAISSYKSIVQKLVMAKHSGNYLAAKHIGHLMWRYTTIPFVPCDIIVPVPLHWTRKAWRGYNQSEVIGGVIAHKRSVPLLDALKRSKRTQLQRNLSYKQRHENLKHAFTLSVDPAMIKDRHIVLVDDVMTSGSTLQQAARELVRYKPASIVAVVAVRVV